MQVQVGGNIYTLGEGQPLQIQAGQTLRVFYSFSYKAADTATVPIWASLYTRTLGVVNREEQAQTKTTITLDKSITWQTYEGSIDINVGTGVNAGLYGLIVELPGFEGAEAKVDDCIEVTAGFDWTQMIGLMVVVMMMGMIMPMMEEGLSTTHG